MQSLIKKALNDYKEKIDNQKNDELSLSDYTVSKIWGSETWLELNEFYAFKIIKMKAGHKSSLQSHKYKVESNYIIDGKALVLLENKDGIMEEFEIHSGEGWTVPVGRKHRVIAITDYIALEVSSPHLDDVIRYQDDANRPSGKIDSEHSV